ncbi:MAG: hypothetical protein ACLGH0_14735, partial [Thermoanaerobaculia bacterium]
MQPLTRKGLVAYVRHCRDLVRDINSIVNDRKLEQQAWKFDYAVDFSEVFGFVLPQESHESWSFEGLMALTDEEKLRQFRVLARFFRQDRIYLPAPYAIELRTFYDRLRLDTVDSMLRETKLALDEIRLLRDNPEVQGILEGRVHEQERVVKFFEENASYLRAFRRGVALAPLRRLHKLLQRKRIVDLMNPQVTGAGTNASIVEDRYRRLLKQRQRKNEDPAAAASFLDSVAIELLRRANIDLVKKGEKRRILLISRSKHLMKLVEQEAMSTQLRNDVGDIVRHPRTFDPVCRPPDGWTDQHKSDLERRRGSLQLFVRAASEALKKYDARGHAAIDGDGADHEIDDVEIIPDQGLQQLLDEIRRDWALSDNLASALEVDDDENDAAGTTADDQFVAALLALINHGDLFDLLNDRLTEIFGDLNKNHEDLGFHLQKRSAERTYGNLVYPLEFRDGKLRELSCNMARDWRVTLGEANALFARA